MYFLSAIIYYFLAELVLVFHFYFVVGVLPGRAISKLEKFVSLSPDQELEITELHRFPIYPDQGTHS